MRTCTSASSTGSTARPGAGDELVEIVAYHLEQSCKLGSEVGRSETPPPVERAVEALMRAAEKAERREGIREADRYYARALELVGDEQTEQTLELRLGRAGTLNTLGELSKANELLAARLPTSRGVRARGSPGEGADRHGPTSRRSRAGLRRSEAYVAEAEAIAADSGDTALVVRAAYRAAYVRWWFEEAGEAAVEDLRRGLAIAEELGDTALADRSPRSSSGRCSTTSATSPAPTSSSSRCIELAE